MHVYILKLKCQMYNLFQIPGSYSDRAGVCDGRPAAQRTRRLTQPLPARQHGRRHARLPRHDRLHGQHVPPHAEHERVHEPHEPGTEIYELELLSRVVSTSNLAPN